LENPKPLLLVSMGLDTDGNLALLFGEVASVRAVQADVRSRWMLMLLLVLLHCGRLERAKKAEAVKVRARVLESLQV
jgi:hypothetical protein